MAWFHRRPVDKIMSLHLVKGTKRDVSDVSLKVEADADAYAGVGAPEMMLKGCFENDLLPEFGRKWRTVTVFSAEC